MEPLTNKKPGIYLVVDVPKKCRKLHELGIMPGSKIMLISCYDRGPVIVRVNNTQMALGRGIASSIMVK